MLDRGTHLEYRPEIDGLRALAVLAVVLFHTQHPIFSGGFVGVDVFFVISGYLITRNIMSYQDRGVPIFSSFLRSRSRRLLPAFLVTILLSGVFAAYILGPQHLVNFSSSSVMALLLVPNIFFWWDSGYFQIEALSRPLLHYWSLGVEAQFYLAWPFALVFLLRLSHITRIALIVFLMGVSVIVAELFLRYQPEFAFFMFPCRLFEFLVGAICVFVPKNIIKSEVMREAVLAAALSVIIFCVLTYNKNTIFPGLTTLPVVLSSMLIILTGSTRVVGSLLENRASVFLGVTSYSLYLVHWPIFTLYKYHKVDSIGLLEGGALVIFAFTCSFAMYFTIERPFRTRRIKGSVSDKVFYLGGLICVISIVAGSLFIKMTDGLKFRYTPTIADAITNIDRKIDRAYRPVALAMGREFPRLGVKNGVIIGDSLARDAFNAIAPGNKVNYTKLTIEDRCQPMLGPRPLDVKMSSERSRSCDKRFRDIVSSSEVKSADVVVLSASWRDWSVSRLRETILEIRAVTEVPIVVFGARMAFLNVPRLVHKYREVGELDLKVNEYQDRRKYALNEKIKHQTQGLPNVMFVNVLDLFCRAKVCPSFTPEGKIIYYDHHHWTLEGAQYFGELLRENHQEAASVLFVE